MSDQTQTITLELDSGPMVATVFPSLKPTPHPPVLLVHGWGGSGRYWMHAVERLRQRFCFIVPDLPGAGRSLPVYKSLDMFDQVSAIESLVDHLNLRQLHVVGHSMGSGIAMLLAAKHPWLIDRLVLTAISLFRSDAERTFFATFTEMVSAMMRFRAPWMADIPPLSRQIIGHFFYQLPEDEQLIRDLFLDYLQMDYDTAVALARSAADPAINAAAHCIEAPTLLVVAQNDSVMPTSNVDTTLKTIPDCQVHWMRQCGHFPMIEYPNEYAAILSVFLRKQAHEHMLIRPVEFAV
ncbi:MAG: hypothetical protein GFH27_549323n103 [Chloroflexi bacterium AL-W]|nr:hypothetical protein [Chloroflexi bacterium AL-N1]NOK70254.1 hypothetical protein [Chloroflexi bacterium AL-N10]NOK77791.1 hypothetical protein [Chloroflexi bacterium AL-N5]NOK84800.1 hypothetical protein [Chloroflexi bacterium AL-W]NOK92407.1 hypothetical protein [Chloroflexi bacterium AL-N15]